ncbi:MAG: conjugal transfer protein TraX, partial [Comamonadaceae bacterium]
MQPIETPSAPSPRDHKPSPPWSVSNGSLETLKWIALVLMAGDHFNKYLLDASVPALFDLGRLVVPIFGYVLMYNLCRPGALAAGVHLRVLKRLTVFGLLATPASMYLVGPWPLNIMFMLFTATLMVYLWQSGGRAGRA